MGAWNGWYHVTAGTYGTWLPGDPRGWRSRHHRRHVEGDYKHRPTEDFSQLHKWTRGELDGKPVTLTCPQRTVVGQALVAAFLQKQVELLSLSMGGQHLHLLARFGALPIRPTVGWAKKIAYHALVHAGWKQGAVWAARCQMIPITGRDHQVNAYGYILDHAHEGAWTWSYREGPYWVEEQEA